MEAETPRFHDVHATDAQLEALKIVAAEVADLMDDEDPQVKKRAWFPICYLRDGERNRVVSYLETLELYWWFLRKLIYNGLAMEAARILWSKTTFNTEPSVCKQVWDAYYKSDQALIMGASALGKSYILGVCVVVDWLADPRYTAVKVISTSKEHAKRNAFAYMRTLVQEMRIKLPPLDAKATSISVNDDQKNGIHLVGIPQGDNGKGRLRGFHPAPRPNGFGPCGSSSRIRVVLDEAEEIPNGVWEDMYNILSTKGQTGTVKVVCATNPKDKNSQFGVYAMPRGGWESIRLDEDYNWVSKYGFTVVRLDAARFENVVQKKEIFKGMQTYEGYQGYLGLGDNHPTYHCVDTKTEVLSLRGWLKYTELSVGDLIYTLNPESGIAEWKPVSFVFKKRYTGNLIEMKSRGFSALVTPNHKWATTYKNKKDNGLILKETTSLAKHDLIPLIRNDKNIESSQSELFAELVGWIVSDGTYRKNNYDTGIVINQSWKANEWKCKRIRDILTEMGIKFSEIKKEDGITDFRFSGTVARQIRKYVPDKKLTIEFIFSLSHESRKALLRGLVEGDGGLSAGGKHGGIMEYVCTSDEQQAGVYCALIASVGLASTSNKRIIKSSIKGYNFTSDMWYITIRKSKYIRNQYIKKNVVQYDDIVWCPTTENGTFFARREGTHYFTGNTMARGMFPLSGADYSIVSDNNVNKQVGSYSFPTGFRHLMAVDLAFEGGDNAVLTIGRFGLADGYTDPMGEYVKFDKEREVLEAFAQFPLGKKTTLDMADEIMRHGRNLTVRPENVVVDRTGNGTGVHDVLVAKYGDVVGLHFGAEATEMPVMSEDSKKACDLYDGLVSEVWFATAKWLEFNYLRFSEMFPLEKNRLQLTSRKFRQVKGDKLRVESKRDYKDRGYDSPDEADSLTMLVHAARICMKDEPAILRSTYNQATDTEKPKTGTFDKLPYLSFGD